MVDRIISDRAVFDVTPQGLVLRAMAPGESVDELRTLTATDFTVQLAG